MKKKRFGSRWTKWEAGCLKSINFSIMINGRPRGKFRATRGLGQRDPLSPFLFVLCADALSLLLKRSTKKDV